jgi:hypothetical protein
MTDAERQARYRAARAAGAPGHPHAPSTRSSRPRPALDDNVAGLVEAQAEYAAWLDSLPDSLQDSATAVSMPIEFSPKVPAENSPLRYASIASKPTRRFDVGEDIKIEFDDGLESLGGGAVAKTVGQGVVPGGVFGLQGEQFGDGVAPPLWSGASIRRSAVADQR